MHVFSWSSDKIAKYRFLVICSNQRKYFKCIEELMDWLLFFKQSPLHVTALMLAFDKYLVMVK